MTDKNSSVKKTGSRTYRAALIGCGGMGRVHALGLAGAPGIELVALADVLPASLNRIGEELGIAPAHRYLDYEILLQQEKPDFIIVATQAPQHAPVTLAAAAHGVHVICEKPLALNLAEADAMVAACRQAGVLLATNHLRRVAPAARMGRDMIAAGEIGDIVAVDIHDKGGRPVGNTLMEMSTHYFDMARFLLSRRQLADGRRSDQIEWVFAHLSTDLGAAAHPARPEEIVPSQVARPTDRDCGLVLGERGTVILGLAGEVQAVVRYHNRPKADSRYDGTDVIGTHGSLAVRGGMEVHLYRRQGHTWGEHDSWQRIPVEGALSDSVADQQPGDRNAGMLRCRDMALELVAAIEEGREHVSSGADGLAALEAVMAVYVSHRLGVPVTLPLADRRHPLNVWQGEDDPQPKVGQVKG